MKTTRITSLMITAVLAFTVPTLACAEELPWKKNAPAAKWSPTPVPQPHPVAHGGYRATHHVRSAPVGNRAMEDRKLNQLATKYYAITPEDPKVVEKLKALEGEVHKFRKNLNYAGYDAHDIIKDAKNLEWRISSQRKKLEAQETGSAPAPAPSPSAGGQ